MPRRLLQWLWSLLPGRRAASPVQTDGVVEQHDRFASEIERDQREIEARLRLLEHQARLRGGSGD